MVFSSIYRLDVNLIYLYSCLKIQIIVGTAIITSRMMTPEPMGCVLGYCTPFPKTENVNLVYGADTENQ